MVYDSIQNAEIYFGLGERVQKALEFLRDTDFENMEPGKIEIDGDNIFAIVAKYETKPTEEGKWEAHRKYLDIQYMVKGIEDFGFVNIDFLDPNDDYNEEKDIEFFKGGGDYLQFSEDDFLILYPQDVHMPGLIAEEKEEVLKIIVKVLI